MKAQRDSRDITLLFLSPRSYMGWVVNATPRPLCSRCPLYRRLLWPQVQSVRVRKISQPSGFDPRTVQPIAQSQYRLSYSVQLYCA